MKSPESVTHFHYVSYAQEVVFGQGSLARLAESLEHLRWQRFMLITSHSMRANGHANAVEAIVGDRLVAVFDHVLPHVQDVQVREALALAAGSKVEAVIGIGGGSPIGMAKAVAYALEKQQADHPASSVSPLDQPLVPVIAIPTTYAGSEMTAVYGVTHTDEMPARKVTVSDPRVAPKLVVYDPELTLDLPPELTASSGINALAHCIEALYSVTRHPSSTAAAISGVANIASSLLKCYEQGDDLNARTQMLTGSHLAGLSLASASMGLHHGLCHVLGGVANVPHGIANSIILPHAIRFNSDMTATQLLPAAEALGVLVNGGSATAAIEATAQRISELAGQMKLPQRLRDAGVKESDLPRLAQLGFENRTVQNNPKPIRDREQIATLLRAAW
jgi:alcohol dehydrogenase class IV